MNEKAYDAKLSKRSRLWRRFCGWAWGVLYPVVKFIYFNFLFDEYKLKGNSLLLGLRECLWTYMCGHDDFVFALRMGNIYWGIGKTKQ